MILSHFWAQKSKMAAKIQDGGRNFFILLTKKLDMVLKNSHTKNGAWCRSVTGQSFSDSTREREGKRDRQRGEEFTLIMN